MQKNLDTKRNGIRTVFATVDNHTLGIQTVASVIVDAGWDASLFYLPSHLKQYPDIVEKRIVEAFKNVVVRGQDRTLVGIHLKELSHPRAFQLARSLRSEFQDQIVLVAGGTYATSVREELLAEFDHVVVGDAEGIIPIAQSMEMGIVVSSVIERPPRKFRYPLHAKAHVLGENGHISEGYTRPLVHPQYKHRQSIEIMLETGCGYACSFCEVAALRQMFGSAYRILQSDPVQAINAIRHRLDLSSEIEYIYFFDEDFLLKSEKWIDTFTAGYASIGLPFFIFATPRSISKGTKKLFALANVGLDTVNMGVQSGSKRIAQDLFGRKESRAEIVDVLGVLTSLYRNGRITSPPMIDWIILNPYETSVDATETIRLLRDLPLPFNAVMHCMGFFRGTPLQTKAMSDGIVPADYKFQYDLHDFLSRIKTNEFGLDFSSRPNLEWLKINTILAGMNGLHRIENGMRYFGSVVENGLQKYLDVEISLKEIAELATSFPNPMDGILFPWERGQA